MSDAARRDADAVRYIVLRKLASGLRHTLMGELQSIQFLSELGARLLQNGADETRMRECVGKIPLVAGEAMATGHSVIEWLRPDEGASTTLGEVVRQCVKLAGDDWRLRATHATVAMGNSAGEARVSRTAARELVVTSLLALTDLHPGALDVEVVAEQEGDSVELRVRARRSSRAPPFPSSTIYHALDWDDVAVLAAAHGVACTCGGDTVALRFAVLPAIPGSAQPREAQRPQ